MREPVDTRRDMSLPGPGLPRGDVHVWCARVDRWSGRDDELSAEEMARASRFRYERVRRQFVAARVLVRRVLARYLEVVPEELVLDADEDGRPLIIWPGDAAWLSFSISHSGDFAVVAVAREQHVGVDVEEIRSDLDVVAVARRALGEAEADELARAPQGLRTQTFFELWTREEARGKCRGTGLIEPDDERRRGALAVADFPVGDGYAAAVAATERLANIRCCVIGV